MSFDATIAAGKGNINHGLFLVHSLEVIRQIITMIITAKTVRGHYQFGQKSFLFMFTFSSVRKGFDLEKDELASDSCGRLDGHVTDSILETKDLLIVVK